VTRAFVLDSWAVLAWVGGEEPAASEVSRMLDAAARGRIRLGMTMINLGEVYYAVSRAHGRRRARDVRQRLQSAPIDFASIDDDLVWEAADIKADHPLSYADAFSAALAARLGTPLVTGDPDFKVLEKKKRIAVRWLRRGS
jgi:ribonuclease VapC